MSHSTPKEKIVNSTLIRAYTYDDKEYTLTVTFADGRAKDYYNVMPPVISAVFDTSGSVGAKFHKQIGKAGYRSEQAEP